MAEGNRPLIKLPMTVIDKVIEVVSIALIVGIFIQIALLWNTLPNKIPMHFNAAGNIDSWGGKGTAIVLPIVILCLYTLITVLSRFPRVFNYTVEITEQNAEFQYKNAKMMLSSLKIIIIILFTYLQQTIINSAQGSESGLGAWFLPVFLVLILGDLTFFIARMSKNK